MFFKCPSVSELCGILAKIQIPANLLLGKCKLEHAFLCFEAALCGLRDISSQIPGVEPGPLAMKKACGVLTT